MAEEPIAVSQAIRGRTVSDAMSGLSLSRDSHEAYSGFTQDELELNYARFKQYDLDNTGLVTAENLKSILEAMEMPDVTDTQCVNMIAEVAMLVGHENDGKLSFRDYCSLLTYEAKKKLEDEVYQAHEELRNSLRIDEEEDNPPPPAPVDISDGGAPTPTFYAEALAEELGDSIRVEEEDESAAEMPAPAAPSPPAESPAVVRRRGSSFAVFDTIASSRIGRFEQVIQDVAVKEKADAKAMYKKTAFENKLSKFKKIETAGPSAVNAEDMHKKTLKAKLHAFEVASKKSEPIAFKTSWKNVRPGGGWSQKKTIAGGVAPKKTIAEIMAERG